MCTSTSSLLFAVILVSVLFIFYLRVSAVLATATWLGGWLSVTAGIVSKRLNLS